MGGRSEQVAPRRVVREPRRIVPVSEDDPKRSFVQGISPRSAVPLKAGGGSVQDNDACRYRALQD